MMNFKYMKKITTLIIGMLLSFLAYSQSYHSFSYEVITVKGKTLISEDCDVDFLVDTVGKTLTSVSRPKNHVSIIYLQHKSPFSISNGQFITWGYDTVRAIGGIKHLSFTHFVSTNKLAAINIYADSTAIVFYIDRRNYD